MLTQYQHLMAHVKTHWPEVRLYDRQRESLEALTRSIEVCIVAGNKLGKDYQAGLVALTFFLWPWLYFDAAVYEGLEAQRRESGMPFHLVHTRKVVTTSVKEKHLSILWGEIGRFVTSSSRPLLDVHGGPLTVNAFEIRLKEEALAKKPINYLTGQVAQQGESMAGHHAAYTLFIGDEASGLWDEIYRQAQGWAKRFLIFGNPNSCQNFFRKMVDGGDILAGATSGTR